MSAPSLSVEPAALHGPEFSSYRADEVTWLLTDLAQFPLEASTEVREAAIQSGAHYAESLPIEYRPTPEYHRVFRTSVTASAGRVAHAVGVVTDLVLSTRPRAVLVSLARAGTPIGILMRRWAAWKYGRELPHYALSIVRGRGIDRPALRYIAARHNPADVVFVDGWTGKGAIARELRATLAEVAAQEGLRFDPRVAVLADPGHCVTEYGTRDDLLIPSACLNATVSGLVSRTVRNDRIIGAGRFDGAKFYRDLAAEDVSGWFLDTVAAEFQAIADSVAADWPRLAGSDRSPDWRGWRQAVEISARYDIGSVNLVKPGIGETTRVLLRRVPARVLVRTGAAADLGHVLLLAAQRGVPVEEVDDLPYACVGLIAPQRR